MQHRAPTYGVSSRAADGVAPMATIFSIMTIVVIVGTGLFIIALGIALGVGFGVGLRRSTSYPVKLSAPIVTCSALATCGCATYSPTFSSRIVNGDIAATNSWPWLVYITVNNVRTCTGFIISPRHVLTAASCVAQTSYNITVNTGINVYQYTYGGVNVTNATALQTINVGDIAVIILGYNITYTSTVKPCCITSSTSVPTVGTHGVIAGWGETSPNTLSAVSPNLRQAVVQVLNSTTCSGTANDTLCAGYGSISACPIDAGGPLMVNNNNLWTCVGIITGRSTCNSTITFTRVASYAAQILNITQIPLF